MHAVCSQGMQFKVHPMVCLGAEGSVLQHSAFLKHAPDLTRASIFYFILFITMLCRFSNLKCAQ